MRVTRLTYILFILIISSAPISAVDYKPDTTFSANLGINDLVQSAYMQPDGKIIIGGVIYTGSGLYRPFVKRINPDGTTDPTFNVPVTSQGDGIVNSIRPLPGGKFLITGSFTVNSIFTNYARLNSDGSLDTSLTMSSRTHIRDIQPDGKFLACTTITFQSYFPVRLNTDGTTDPSFQVTGVDQTCPGMRALPNGKIMIGGEFTTNGQPAEPLFRLNSNGSLDPTFDSPFNPGSSVTLISILTDGKIMVRSSLGINRLFPDGALDVRTPSCHGDVVQPLADGNFFMTECQRSGTLPMHRFVRVLSNGVIDPTYDYISTSVHEPTVIRGLLPDGNGNCYVYGGLISMNGVATYGIGRLVPETTPAKAKFDFDGDGKSDIAIYRPSNGYWYLNQSTAGVALIPWGLPNDRPIATRYDSDGRTDVTIFRDGVWHSNTSAQGHCYMYLGDVGDKPLVAELNGYYDDNEDFAVRGLRFGIPQWFIRSGPRGCYPANNQQPSPIMLSGELASDKPIVGDFSGDSRNEIGYYRDGFWYSADYENATPPLSFQFGSAGDIPVPADYDGDRQTDYAVFRPSKGTWYINRSTDGMVGVRFGQIGDVPVPADYDGDGKTDLAIYRNGIWWQYLSATGTINIVNWGLSDDIPIPAQTQ